MSSFLPSAHKRWLKPRVSVGRMMVLLTISADSCGGDGARTKSLELLCSYASLRRTPAITSQSSAGLQSTCAYCPPNSLLSSSMPTSFTGKLDVGGGKTAPLKGTVYALLLFNVV